MKFSKKLNEFSNPKYRNYYIAYKDLKKAIKLITGIDTSSFTIRDVTSNFGNIKALSGSIYRPAESRFQDLLNHELEKINNFTSIILNTIYESIRSALKKLYESELSDAEILEIENSIDEQANEIVFLDSYQRLNFAGFRKITKKYDKNNKSASSFWYISRLIKEYFMNINFDFFLVLLSVTYSKLRDLKNSRLSKIALPLEKESAEFITQIPSYNSDSESVKLYEKSTKYLVQPNDIMRVKVLISKFVSLSVLGAKRISEDTLRQLFLSSQNKYCEHLFSFSETLSSEYTTSNALQELFRRGYKTTNCIYFDNENFDEYKNLISNAKENNMKSFRFRFFKEQSCLAVSNSSDKKIFIEKIENSQSENAFVEVEEDSLDNFKHSLSMHEEFVIPFIRNNLDIECFVNQKFEEEKREDARNLLLFVNEKITSSNLKPSVRTIYSRTSFKSKEGSIYISMDENLRFISELKSNRDEYWLRQTTDSLVSEEAEAFAWGILNIEVFKPHQAFFLKQITGLASVTKVWNFSIFTHGVAHLHRSKLAELPHWFLYTSDNSQLHNEKDGKSEAEKNEKKTKSRAFIESQDYSVNIKVNEDEEQDILRNKERKEDCKTDIKVDVLLKGAASRIAHEQEASMQEYLTADRDNIKAFNYSKPTSNTKCSTARKAAALQQCVSQADSGSSCPNSSRQQVFAGSHNKKVYPLAPLPHILECAAKEKEYRIDALNDLSSPLLQQEETIGKIVNDRFEKIRILRGGHGGGDATAGGMKASQLGGAAKNLFSSFSQNFSRLLRKFLPSVGALHQRDFCASNRLNDKRFSENTCDLSQTKPTVRVEPKTFFANERTLLQWMNTAVLISTISMTLLNFGTSLSRTAGLILSPVSIFFILYPFLVFMRRSYSLERKEPINYNDRFGPTVLVVCLVSSLTTILVLNVIYGGADMNSKISSAVKSYSKNNLNLNDNYHSISHNATQTKDLLLSLSS